MIKWSKSWNTQLLTSCKCRIWDQRFANATFTNATHGSQMRTIPALQMSQMRPKFSQLWNSHAAYQCRNCNKIPRKCEVHPGSLASQMREGLGKCEQTLAIARSATTAKFETSPKRSKIHLKLTGACWVPHQMSIQIINLIRTRLQGRNIKIAYKITNQIEKCIMQALKLMNSNIYN